MDTREGWITPGRRARKALCLLVVLLALPMASPQAAADATTVPMKEVAPGAGAFIQADVSSPNIPSVPPVFGSSPLTDGDFVYDSSLQVQVSNFGQGPVTVSVIVEEWTWGETSHWANETGPNGTLIPQRIYLQTPVDQVWARNTTITSWPGDSGYGQATILLPNTTGVEQLTVHVGFATWNMQVETPAVSSLQWVDTSGGLPLLVLLVTGVVFACLLVALWRARALAKVIGMSPPVPWLLWPVPIAFVSFFLVFEDYVPFNQFVNGTPSTLFLPAMAAVAAYPYLPRLWHNYEIWQFHSVKGTSTEDAEEPTFSLPMVRTRTGLRCSCETWVEVFAVRVWGKPLPPVRGKKVTVLGQELRMPPKSLPSTLPEQLTEYYRVDTDRSAQYDARYPLRRVRYHLERGWHTRNKLSWTADGLQRTTVKVRDLLPHWSEAYLEGVFPRRKDVAAILAEVYDAQTMSSDNEEDRLAVSHMLGVVHGVAHAYARADVEQFAKGRKMLTSPRSPEELRRRATSKASEEKPQPPPSEGEDREHEETTHA